MGLSVSYVLNPLDRVPGVEEQPPAGSVVVVEHEAPVAHALQVAPDLLRLAVLFPPHELQLHSLVYPVVEFHQASSTLDVSLSYRTPYATTGAVRALLPSATASASRAACYCELPRTPFSRTSENSVKTKFAEFTFHALR